MLQSSGTATSMHHTQLASSWVLLAVIVAMLMPCPCAAIPATWGGIPEELLGRATVLHTERGGGTFDADSTPWVEQVGLHPKVYYFHNFLTEAERTHMIRLAAPVMRRSQVSTKEGAGAVIDARTSYGTFLSRLHDPVIERIERRISLFTHIPVSHQEEIQVLRYSAGQAYKPHYDSSYDTPDDHGPHFRQATFLMYLSDVEEGGETAFPHQSEWADPSIPEKMGPVSDCAKGHVAAKPKAGDAVLFYSYHPNKTMDEASMHTGCPVIKGIKWAAPVWIHVDEWRPEEFAVQEKKSKAGAAISYAAEPGMCVDNNPMCANWAAKGECEKTPMYMVGDAGHEGNCLKSCKRCSPCSAGDMECINNNRVQAGFLKMDKEEMQWLGLDWWFNDGPSPEL